jgi:hypothetical protein
MLKEVKKWIKKYFSKIKYINKIIKKNSNLTKDYWSNINKANYNNK